VNFTTQARTATAMVGTTLSLTLLAACASSGHHGTGSITPVGSTRGTFRYCSYTPDSDGIEISHHEATPCVVGDARSKKDRKKKGGVTVPPTAKPTKTTSRPTLPSTTPTSSPPSSDPTAANLAKKPASKKLVKKH
jgi:hypothetical protein